MKELQQSLTAFGEIQVGIVGAGLMGSNLCAQLVLLDGFKPAVVSSQKIESVLSAFKNAGITKEEIVITNSQEEMEAALKNGKYVATTNNSLTYGKWVHCTVDCTGNTVAGAEVAKNALENGTHVVSLNVETDVVVGTYLKKLAEMNDLVYTGTYGDEPGAIIELFEFCEFVGFEVVALGKGKNNELNFEATPLMLEEEAHEKGLSPRMLTSFVDGTNTMIELNAVCNATGFLPDIPGCHGLTTTVSELASLFLQPEQGGMMTSEKVVEFVKGIAPGVFAIVRCKSPIMEKEMKFLKMGEGPLFTIYRPYHLTSIETPISIAKAVIHQETSIEPLDEPVAETIAVAKKDLKVGDSLEGIGGYGVYGKLVSATYARKNKCVPIGLLNVESKALKNISKGEELRLEDVKLEENFLTTIWKESNF